VRAEKKPEANVPGTAGAQESTLGKHQRSKTADKENRKTLQEKQTRRRSGEEEGEWQSQKQNGWRGASRCRSPHVFPSELYVHAKNTVAIEDRTERSVRRQSYRIKWPKKCIAA